LKAEGFATHGWIKSARQRGPTIPGIVALEIGGVVDMDRTRFDAAVARIESKNVYFIKEETQFAPDQEESLLDLSRSVLALQRLRSDAGINFSLMIIGHTDTSGKREANLRLSRERALQVQLYLIQQGCDPAGIATIGVGDQALAVSQEVSVATELNRSVSFRIIAH
jgi:outer membrane protein OmpA-like peptidoglycan-associated protein